MMTEGANSKQSSPARQELSNIEEMLNSGSMQTMRQKARSSGVRVVPKNASSIVLLRGKPGQEEIIMGRRNQNLKFMPGALVFPGGRVDQADWRIPCSDPLDPVVEAKLMAGMKNRASKKSAHSLGIAAIRELFEETGFLIGAKSDKLPSHADWSGFKRHGIAPSLSGLRLLARAITPPGMARRFDTWFFVVRLDESHIEPDEGFVHSSELEELRWIKPGDAMVEDTREITRVILLELINRLKVDPELNPDTPAAGYRVLNNRFKRQML